MYIEDFFSPVPAQLQAEVERLGSFTIGKKVCFSAEMDAEKEKLVLLGISDSAEEYSRIRQQLYQLKRGDWSVEIHDLGNFKPGKTIEDSLFALQETFSFLTENNCKVVVIGADPEALMAYYQSQEKLLHFADFTTQFPLNKANLLTQNNYLTQMITGESQHLYRYSCLGYQTYYVGQEEIDLMENLNFEFVRLGLLKSEIKEVEPYVREVDFAHINMAVIQHPDFTATNQPEPNGFNSIEACTISKYLGAANKVKAFFLSNYEEELDVQNMGARLMAQMIWYFAEGLSLRLESPTERDLAKYSKHIVMAEGHDILFYKDETNNRWWLFLEDEKHGMIFEPCSYNDYLNTVDGKLPLRWWRLYKRFSLL